MVLKPSIVSPGKQVVELVVTQTDPKGLVLPAGSSIDDTFGFFGIVLGKAGLLKSSFGGA